MTPSNELKLCASHDNPICTVVEFDFAMGPNGEATRAEVSYGD